MLKRATGLALLLAGVPAQASEPAQAMPTSAEATNEAEAAFRRSLEAYANGDVPGALRHMLESYRLSGRSELLYNLARLHGELGRCEESLNDYRSYLAQVPDGRYRADAQVASRELAAKCGGYEAAPPAPPATPAAAVAATTPTETGTDRHTTPAYWTTQRTLGWSAVAAGAVAGVGAGYFFSEAVDARTRFKASVDRQVEGGPHADFGLRDEQHRAQKRAQVLAIAGGGLALGGALILLLTPRAAPPATTVYVMPDSFGISYARSF